MEKFIIASGVATRYSDTEIGQTTILLLHGYMQSIDIWDSFSDQLKNRYRVVCVDIPGHGVSEVVGQVHTMERMADVIYDLLCAIGVERCVVVGHSMGGYIANALAVKHPDMVEKMVFFHSLPGADTPERKKNREREIEIIRTGRKELLSKTSPGKSLAPVNRRRLEYLVEEMTLQVMLTEDEGILALLEGMMQRSDLSQEIDALGIPQLYFFGEQDQLLPSDMARESMAQKGVNTQVVWLPDAGHMGFIEQEKISLEALTTFIEQGCAVVETNLVKQTDK